MVRIAAKHQPHDVLVADALNMPHPYGAFDFVISIAVIHHLSTPQRRVEAVAELLKHLRPSSGQVLIFVWALEQQNSRRGWDSTDEQDAMVPWVMKSQAKGSDAKDQTFYRYYHLYRSGELDSDIRQAGGSVVASGYERDNWWAVATNGSS